MRTTISIDEQLLERTKGIALASKRTLGQVIEDGLRVAYFSDEKSDKPPRSHPLVTFRGTGLRPGVNPCDSAGLLETMEGA